MAERLRNHYLAELPPGVFLYGKPMNARLEAHYIHGGASLPETSDFTPHRRLEWRPENVVPRASLYNPALNAHLRTPRPHPRSTGRRPPASSSLDSFLGPPPVLSDTSALGSSSGLLCGHPTQDGGNCMRPIRSEDSGCYQHR